MSVLEMEGKRIFNMVQTNERKSSTYRHIFHPNTSLTGQNGQNSHFRIKELQGLVKTRIVC